MEQEQAILHKAEEYGQSRAYTTNEVKAVERAMLTAGVYGAIVAAAIAGAVLLYQRLGIVWTAGIMLIPVGFLIGAGLVLAKGMNEQLDGLRSFRSIETYAPPVPEPLSEPHPPILVKPYQGSPYTIGGPSLPDRQEALQLTPPVVAEILKASVEEYGGKWSRRKLMRLRVAGQKVTRGMYEELTGWLQQTGILLQERQGGFTLPPNVSKFDDLRIYFPNLPALGGPGGNREGRERGASQVSRPPGGEVGTLAERRRQRWLECGHDVTRYLEEKP